MSNPFMQEAIRLAMEGVRQDQGGPFGAVVVRDGQIIGRGWNQVLTANDPTAHAEIVAIRDACGHADDFSLAGCDLYASCEPCPMCLAAVYWARLDTLYFAATRYDAAAAGFDDEQIYREVTLDHDGRSIPTRQLSSSEALHPFELWTHKTDRRMY